MTSLVGIKCSDGVVIAADSAATLASDPAHRTIEQPTEKISIIGDQIIIAGTGAVGLNQRFVRVVHDLYSANRKEYSRRDPWTIAKELSAAGIKDFSETYLKTSNFGALVAFPGNGNRDLCLFEYAVADFQPEMMKDDQIWYVSMGSAKPITDPFLALMREVFWRDGPPTLADGIFAATWTLDLAIKINSGGVNGPLRMAVLEIVNKHATARMVEGQELLEHFENIEGAKEALRAYRRGQQPDGAPAIPEFLQTTK